MDTLIFCLFIYLCEHSNIFRVSNSLCLGTQYYFPADTVQNLDWEMKLRNLTLIITILNLKQNKIRVSCKYNGTYTKNITKTFTDTILKLA